MSFDLKYDSVCDHRTHLENHQAEPDRQTIKLPRPVHRSAFHVYMNGYEVKPNDPNYGWYLTVDPNGGTPDYYMLVFRRKLRANDDVFQLSYQTSESNCRRCHGRRLYMDISIDPQGQFRTIKDETKLVQDMRKGVLTIRGTNNYAAWYGTALVTLIGIKVGNSQVLQLRLQREVSTFMDNLLKIQVRQAEVQRCTLRELIQQVLGIETNQLDNTGGYWEVVIRAATRAGNQVSFTEPLDLYQTASLDAIMARAQTQASATTNQGARG